MVFLPAPSALGEGFDPSLIHGGLPLAVVGLLRNYEVDARVVRLGIIPVGVPGEVGHGLAMIQKPLQVYQGALGDAEGDWMKGLSFGFGKRENNYGMSWSSQSLLIASAII